MLDWRPFLLRPDLPEEGSPLPSYVRQYLANPDNPLFMRARRLGLTLAQREWVPSTRRAHACAEYARARGRLDPFARAVLQASWARAEDLHDWAVLRAAALAAGLDAADMQAQVETGALDAALRAGLDEAAALGVQSVPTFVVGGRFVIQGAQEGRVFRAALERLRESP